MPAFSPPVRRNGSPPAATPSFGRQTARVHPSPHVAPPTIAALEPSPTAMLQRRPKNKPLPSWRLVAAAGCTLVLSLVAITLLDPMNQPEHTTSTQPHGCPRWTTLEPLRLLPGPTDSYSRAKALRDRRQRLKAAALAAARKVQAARNGSSLWSSRPEVSHLLRVLQDGRCVADSGTEVRRLEAARDALQLRIDLQQIRGGHGHTVHGEHAAGNATQHAGRRRASNSTSLRAPSIGPKGLAGG